MRGILLFVALGGCGGSDAPTDVVVDDTASLDTAVVDTTPPTIDAPPDGPRGDGVLAARCAKDLDCRAGLTCWSSASGGKQWPLNGMCTKKCTADDDCAALASGSKCRASTSTAPQEKYCMLPCTAGGTQTDSLAQPLDPGKCLGRGDLTCSILGMCVPLCGSDAQCAPARCNPLWGFCDGTAGAPSFEDVGREVIGTSPCSTQLITMTSSGVTLCTAKCAVGVTPGCNWAGPPSKAKAACLYQRSGIGPGDEGLCAELCDCPRDCRAPLKCVKLSDKKAAETGRAGMCAADGVPLITCDGG